MVSRMLNDQIELMNVMVEIDYLVLDVFEPDLSEEDGSVASTGNEEDFGSLYNFSENCDSSILISDDDIHWCRVGNKMATYFLDIDLLSSLFADRVKLGGITRFKPAEVLADLPPLYYILIFIT